MVIHVPLPRKEISKPKAKSTFPVYYVGQLTEINMWILAVVVGQHGATQEGNGVTTKVFK